MIIDCHGHYTTEPKDLHRFRKDQTAPSATELDLNRYLIVHAKMDNP